MFLHFTLVVHIPVQVYGDVYVHVNQGEEYMYALRLYLYWSYRTTVHVWHVYVYFLKKT